MQSAIAIDNMPGLGDRAVFKRHIPDTGCFIKAHFNDLGTMHNMRTQLVLVHAALYVLLNFNLRRIDPGPVRIRLKRITVKVRRYVAGGSGIGVVVPGSTNAICLIINAKIMDAAL